MSAEIQLRSFRAEDTEAVVALWQQCGLARPVNDPRKDIARKMKVRGDLFLVAMLAHEIIGTVMIGYEGHRGWINYLGVSPAHRKIGCGRLMMQEAERQLRKEGCSKINLQVFPQNAEALAFYRAIGYIQDPVLSYGKRLETDE